MSPITPGLNPDAKTAVKESRQKTASDNLRTPFSAEYKRSPCALRLTAAERTQKPSFPETGSKFTSARNKFASEKYKQYGERTAKASGKDKEKNTRLATGPHRYTAIS